MLIHFKRYEAERHETATSVHAARRYIILLTKFTIIMVYYLILFFRRQKFRIYQQGCLQPPPPAQTNKSREFGCSTRTETRESHDFHIVGSNPSLECATYHTTPPLCTVANRHARNLMNTVSYTFNHSLLSIKGRQWCTTRPTETARRAGNLLPTACAYALSRTKH